MVEKKKKRRREKLNFFARLYKQYKRSKSKADRHFQNSSLQKLTSSGIKLYNMPLSF